MMDSIWIRTMVISFTSHVKIAIFWAILYFWGDLRHALRPQSNTRAERMTRITMVLIKIECIIKYYPFECTSIWTDIIKRLWKVKKMVMVRLKLQDILWFINEHPLKCKKTLNRQALVDNFLRPSTLLLWKFLIF